MKPPSQADIARLANVSQAVVSAVLSNKPTRIRYSHAVKERIHAVAAELGYRVNPGARLLLNRRTRTLGLILSNPDSVPYIPATIYTGVCRAAAGHGYYLSLIHDPQSPGQPDNGILPRSFGELHVDGYLVFHTGYMSELLEQNLSEDSQHPVVFINDDRPKNAIRPDDSKGIRDAVKHLLASGYRQPAFFDIPASPTNAHYSSGLRLRTYRTAMRRRKLQPLEFQVEREAVERDLAGALAGFLEENPGIDALICSTDFLACLLMIAADQLGIVIPDQLGVIGVNDEMVARLAHKPLTSLAIDWEGMAAQAVDLLVESIESDTPVEHALKILPMKLNVRQSTARGSCVRGSKE